MGQFFKFLFASCLGTFLALVLIGFIGVMVMVGVASSGQQKVNIKPNTVLHLQFNKEIPEKTNNLPLDPFSLENQKILGLQEIVETLERAAKDDNIKGVFLEVDDFYAGLATTGAIRQSLMDFKESGKFITAYGKYESQSAYYLTTTADEIFLHPLGIVDFRGFSVQVPHFKNLFDKIGVNAQVYYAGKFKSATEPYRRSEMSPENRLQYREFLDEIYNRFINEIASARKINQDSLRRYADEFVGLDTDKALAVGMVDGLAMRDSVLLAIKSKVGLGEKDKLQLVDLENYNASLASNSNFKIKDKIAVLYAEGAIVDGKAENGMIGDEEYAEVIQKIRKDDKIKAIVLRVNSGGGSASASETIWKELSLARQEGKPVIVSMGDYAASGGYYIACMADSIFAEPNTLTGSIGVFNMIPSIQNLLKEKLGINVDTVRTGKMSAGFSLSHDLTEEQGAVIQARVNSMYSVFLDRVSEGRDIAKEKVDEIAQGRIWSGVKAMELGLVDQMGDLERAIKAAASSANLDKYRVVEFPVIKDPLLQLLEQWTGEELRSYSALEKELFKQYPQYKELHQILQSNGYQARLPIVLNF